ncbi:MAG: 1-(5-phosphoribosyl)-5-[(5-phosphoribosylamino)methylideneamino]imidazole-4-carboxamide isomerase [Candidatus Omnitrophica bacterium]|jgi:phosphoribosylformimino-5-aminoimidazole carboxamide ribotide isomerase|nr:1-(5-phosphoribosyl)-5-[(5-phosphoribosylamino)methylideneamino]imidazole-4-carboxamide isomerase [Candidatus Omnitrophota bacterium]
MVIIPAIDLYDGKVVRFVKGDPLLSTVYSDNPLDVAKSFKQEGASMLHIVDLSAALGEADNLKIVERILNEVDIKVEVGGGIRSIDIAVKLVSLGAERIVIGTKSLDDNFLKNLTASIDIKKIAVGVDVKEGRLATKGWKEKSALEPMSFIENIISKGIKWIIYTDISRDGTLSGVNLAALSEFSRFKSINFIASGGVSSLEDLKNLKEKLPFVWGCICGKALYDGKFKLKEAISILKG